MPAEERHPRQQTPRPRSRRGGHRFTPARRHRAGDRRATGPGRPGKGVDDPHRPGDGQRRAGLHGRAPLRLGWLGGQHDGRDRRAGRHRRFRRRRRRRRGGPHLRREPAGGRGRIRTAPKRVGRRGRARHRAAASSSSPRTPTAPWGPTWGRPPRCRPEGVPTSFVARASIVLLEGYLWDVPAAKEAMRHAAATAHAARGLGGALPVRPVLRGAPPARVPRPPARRRRHPARQRGGGHHALRRVLVPGRRWRQPRRPGSWSS